MLNLTDYTALQLALYAAGLACWGVALLFAIRNAFGANYLELPAFGAVGLAAWALGWATVFRTTMGDLVHYAHIVLLGFGLVIFYLALQYGRKQTDYVPLQRFWVPALMFCAIATGAIVAGFVLQSLDAGSGINSLYLALLPLSFLSVPLLLKQRTLVAFSWWTAGTRTLGTACLGVFSLLRYPDHLFLLAMAASATAADLAYCGLLAWRKRELKERLDPAATISREHAKIIASASS